MLNFCTMFFGDMHEVINSGRKPSEIDWTMVIYGGLCGFLPWAIMFYEIWAAPAATKPWCAWLAAGKYIVLFACFPYVLIQQARQTGNYNNDKYPLLSNGGYIYGEKVFQFLSLCTKSLIAWLVAGAVVWPDVDLCSAI